MRKSSVCLPSSLCFSLVPGHSHLGSPQVCSRTRPLRPPPPPGQREHLPAQTNLSLPLCLSSRLPGLPALGADTCPLTQAEEPPASPGLRGLRWRYLVNCIHTPQPPCQVLGLLPPKTLQRASLARLGDDRGGPWGFTGNSPPQDQLRAPETAPMLTTLSWVLRCAGLGVEPPVTAGRAGPLSGVCRLPHLCGRDVLTSTPPPSLSAALLNPPV